VNDISKTAHCPAGNDGHDPVPEIWSILAGPKAGYPEAPKGRSETQQITPILKAMMIAYRNHGLYPAHHAASRQSIRQVHDLMQRRLRHEGPLRISVKKDGFWHADEQILETPASEADSLPAVLYRDGIQWIEFEPGLTIDEWEGFFAIVTRYRNLDDESGADLVSALWESAFPHLKYGAVLTWEAGPSGTDEILRPFPAPACGGQPQGGPHEAPMPAWGQSESLWKLSEYELGELKRTVAEEDAWDALMDVLDTTLDLMEQQTNPGKLNDVMMFLQELYVHCIAHHEFAMAIHIWRCMYEMIDALDSKTWWMLSHLREFIDFTHGPAVRHLLVRLIGEREAELLPHLSELKFILTKFPPESISEFAPLLAATASVRMDKTLLETIGLLARDDFDPLARFLPQADARVLHKLIHLLDQMKDEASATQLHQLLRHSSPAIRKNALGCILSPSRFRLETDAAAIFFLIDDPDPAIRRTLLSAISSKRHPAVTRILIAYLEKMDLQSQPHSHITACIRAMGRCGTPECIPLLEKILKGSPLRDIFARKRNRLRHPAAEALMMLDQTEALSIVTQASKNLIPHIRHAAQAALEKRS